MPASTRRSFLRAAAGSFAVIVPTQIPAQEKKEEPEVSPAEDLMREHGVLERVLLVYEESARLLTRGGEFDPKLLESAAGIVRDFVENYHEKLEQDYLFPRFEKANRLTDLVAVLRRQHELGRQVTEQIRKLATAADIRTPAGRRRLAMFLQEFIRMYRPHAAREDTVLFPAFRQIVSANEYDSLGEEFEKKEHTLFGEEGFEKYVDLVAGLEKSLGIYDLSRFSPKPALAEAGAPKIGGRSGSAAPPGRTRGDIAPTSNA